ncbi:unnamed protein product [Prunus brigantina]
MTRSDALHHNGTSIHGTATSNHGFLSATVTHGRSSHLSAATNLGLILEQHHSFPHLPPRLTYALAHTSNEILARMQLGSTQFSHPHPRSQADLSVIVDERPKQLEKDGRIHRQEQANNEKDKNVSSNWHVTSIHKSHPKPLRRSASLSSP